MPTRRPSERAWRRVAASQAGVVTRAQLAELGVSRSVVARRIATERWQPVGPVVVATFTGALTREQLMWAAVLHAGGGALLAGLTAAESAGLRHWFRDEVVVAVPYDEDVPAPLEGVVFVRSRRDLTRLRAGSVEPPRMMLEPAILLFGASDRSERTAQGVLAAAIQQQLTSADRLQAWVERLRPLRRAPLLRGALAEMAGGAQSLAEVDVVRMCRLCGLAPPVRQVPRRDASGRIRFTDCEWRLPNGRIVVLEVDGGFHMEVEHWEDDLARQRALTDPMRLIVRCSGRELRDEPRKVGRDLERLGVPRADHTGFVSASAPPAVR